MPTAYESSQLILELFERRRDASLREARARFFCEFTPETLEALLAIAGGERNASFRTREDCPVPRRHARNQRTPQFARHLETILRRTEGGEERVRTVRERCLRRKRG